MRSPIIFFLRSSGTPAKSAAVSVGCWGGAAWAAGGRGALLVACVILRAFAAYFTRCCCWAGPRGPPRGCWPLPICCCWYIGRGYMFIGPPCMFIGNIGRAPGCIIIIPGIIPGNIMGPRPIPRWLWACANCWLRTSLRCANATYKGFPASILPLISVTALVASSGVLKQMKPNPRDSPLSVRMTRAEVMEPNR